MAFARLLQPLARHQLQEGLHPRARVRLENGAAFGAGGAGFFRVNLACPRSLLAEALDRLKTSINKL